MKYLGGKQRLGKHISPILHALWENSECNGYIEPFCGSLGVFRHMTTLSNAKTIVANDYHPDLIALWNDLQKGEFRPPDSVSEAQYNKAKLLKSPNSMKAFIGFGMSFGGRYFGAFAHKYLGNKNEDFCKEMTNSLNRIAPKIRLPKVKFQNSKYQDLRPNNKLIYCDPPYRLTNHPIKYRTSTKKYDVFDNDEFWDIMRKWSKTNLVVISETTAPNDFVEVWNADMYRSAAQSSKTRFKSKTTKTVQNEKLFVHKIHKETVSGILATILQH
jgi:DNA adenine methylase